MTMIDSPKVKQWSVILTVAFLAWCGFEYFVLRGDVVFSRLVDLNEEVNIVVPISELDESHFGQIAIEHHAIGFEIYDPEGNEVYRHHETRKFERPRHFEFTPEVAGDYTLVMRRNERGKYASTVPDDVKILVNDWRLFTYMFGSDWGEFF